MSRKSDASLLEKCIIGLKQGDGQALKHFYDCWYERIHFYAYKMIGDSPAAQDITIESFANLWHKRGSFDNIQQVKGFLYTSTKNACLNYLRDNKLHGNIHAEIARSEPVSENTIESSLIKAEVTAMIWEEIQNLPPACKKICILLLQEQLTSAEIAARLGIKPQTVDTQLARAAKHLKTIFLRKKILIWLSLFFRMLS